VDVTRSSRDGQDSYRNTSDRSCEPSDTGGHVEIAGDHATQRVAAMGREVMSATREGGEGGAVHGVLEQMRPLVSNLQGKLRGSQEKVDHPHVGERRDIELLVYMCCQGEVGCE